MEAAKKLKSGSKTNYRKSSENYFGADNITDVAGLKEYYKQGKMVGERHVKEWEPYTGYKPDWYETLGHNGNIRQVWSAPIITGDVKVHYMFDAGGIYRELSF